MDTAIRWLSERNSIYWDTRSVKCSVLSIRFLQEVYNLVRQTRFVKKIAVTLSVGPTAVQVKELFPEVEDGIKYFKFNSSCYKRLHYIYILLKPQVK